jgi:hypothetical protein
MAIFISLLAAFVLVIAGGAGVVVLAVPRRLSICEWLALSWLVGSMLVSLGLWLCSFFSRGLFLQAIVSLLCLVLGLLAFVRRESRARTRWTTTECLLLGVLVLQFLAVCYLSFKRTLGWDGLLNWEFKAHIAYQNGGALPANYFADQERAFSHPEYPLGIPNLELWSYFWLGEANQFWIKAIFPCFYAAGALLLAGVVERLSQQRVLGLVAAIVFLFVPQFMVDPGAAVTGYADFPLAVFYLGAIGFLILDRSEGGWFYLAAILLNFLPWLKREGIVLWVTGAICALLFRRGRSLRMTLVGISGGVLILVCWRAYLLAHNFSTVADFGGINPASLFENLRRLPLIFIALHQGLFDLQSWSLLWYAAIAALPVLFFSANRRIGWLLFVAIAIPLCFDLTIYVFSAWPDYLRHVNLSLSRLVMQVAPTAFLLVSVAVAAMLSPALSRGRRNASKDLTNEIGVSELNEGTLEKCPGRMQNAAPLMLRVSKRQSPIMAD